MHRPTWKHSFRKFLLRVRTVEMMPDHFLRLSLFASEHSFWSDMTGTASQEDHLSRLHFDPKVFSVMIEDMRQHVGGQNMVGDLFTRELAATVKAAQAAFALKLHFTFQS